jgi:hypothetical protein
LDGNWINFGIGIFWRQVQRRGTHVNTPKKGSRGDAFCLGGILGFHADLRREIKWGNLKWDSFGVLFGGPRRSTEEGGPFMCQFVHLGEFWGCSSVNLNGVTRGVRGTRCLLSRTTSGASYLIEVQCEGRAI